MELLHLIRLKKPATTVTAIEQHQNNLVWIATGNQVAVYNPSTLQLLAQWEPHTTTLKFTKSMGPNIWTMSNTGDVSIWTLEDVCVASTTATATT
jgi:outer membrane lipoprotein-sorting protein